MKYWLWCATRKGVRAVDRPLALLLCCLSSTSCFSVGRRGSVRHQPRDEFALYRKTNDQFGHELVKTEQFLVPVGTRIVVAGLEFEPGATTLTDRQELIVQQIFNSIEEITENTVGDTNLARVAEFKQMVFEVRGHGDDSVASAAWLSLAEARAKAVQELLTHLGTPSWRLIVTPAGDRGEGSPKSSQSDLGAGGRVEFVRLR